MNSYLANSNVVNIYGEKFTRKDLKIIAEVLGEKEVRRSFMEMIEFQAIVEQTKLKEMLRRKP